MMNKEIEKDYHQLEMPKVRKSISELKTGIGSWGKGQRLLYLKEQFNTVQDSIDAIHNKYRELTRLDEPYLNKYIGTIRLEGLKKELKKIKSEMKYLEAAISGKLNGNGVDPEIIKLAKQYPFENLIEVKKGMALCPFHDDHNPSMSVKNNRYHCFACGGSGDIIDFVMKRDSLTFADAVKGLQ